MSAKIDKKSQLFAVEPGGRYQLEAERAMVMNSALWLRNLRTADESVHLPDGAWSTYKLRHKYTTSLQMVTDATFTTQRWGIIFLQPNMYDQYGYMSAVNNHSPVFTMVDDPRSTEFTNNFYAYRVVAASIRLCNTGALLNRGASVIVGQTPTHTLVSSGVPGWFINVATGEYAAYRDNYVCSSTDEPDIVLSWLPHAMRTGSFSSGAPYGTTFRGMTIVGSSVADTAPFMVVAGTSACSDVFQVEVNICYEFIVEYTATYLFQPSFAIGSVHTLTLVFAQILMMHPHFEDYNVIEKALVLEQAATQIYHRATGGGSFATVVSKLAKRAWQHAKKLIHRKYDEFKQDPKGVVAQGTGLISDLLDESQLSGAMCRSMLPSHKSRHSTQELDGDDAISSSSYVVAGHTITKR